MKGELLDDNDPAIPCGLVAKSFFNDTYVLKRIGENGDDDETIDIKENQIAWTSDVQYKFKNIENIPTDKKQAGDDKETEYQRVQWMDMEEEHFIVWMRTAGLPNFRKLWGRIETPLKKGKYKLFVKNNYKVSPFQGKKSFVISTTNALGGKNYFLAICYVVVGTLCVLFAFVFCIAYMKKRSSGGNQGSV